MWTCPKCRHKFYNTNQSHSCGNYTVQDFCKGKPAEGINLFNALIAEYKKIGDFDLHPVKTRVALLTKMRFCSINRIGDGFIEFHLVLTEPMESELFFKIDNLSNRFYVHHCRIHNKLDLTSELIKYMRLAYNVGERKHVKPRRKRS